MMDEETVDLSVNFSNIRHAVTVREWKSGFCRARKKVILNGVSGSFRSGELVMVMGVSGAGKTSLLNILAGAQKGFSGDVSVIDKGQRARNVNSVYILQDSLVAEFLTVNEAMIFASRFKIGRSRKAEDLQELIDRILVSLSLYELRNDRSTGLSGGEKKRLTIALEMIRDPTVMFFDEPTSGLDYSTSIQCMKVLKKLAKDGRVIIATVHQPTPLVLQECDQLYVLAAGKCIYNGRYDAIVQHLRASFDIVCPQTYNPAEFLLEIASDAYENDWRDRLLTASESPNGEAVDGLLQDIKLRYDLPYGATFFRQLAVLVRRRALITHRDISLIGLRSAIHILCIAIVCILYHGIGRKAEDVLNNMRYILNTLSYFSFVSHSANCSVIPREIPIVKREHFNGWYSILPYYLSLVIVDLPLHLMAATLYAIVTFWVTGQDMEIQRLAVFVAGCNGLAIVGHCIGYTTGFIFNVQNASILGQTYMVAFFVSSGYFITRRDAPSYLQWLFDISFMRHGYNSLVVSIYGFNRTRIDCDEMYCQYTVPKKILQAVDVEDSGGWPNILNLLYLTLVFLVLGYFVARRRILNVTTRK
ncbi:ATP-binding cassette sub-family G member 1-like [Phlebotomus argentipes]|uniref:ATP-binding cassette sub-family G member 1-like n=1 Tax=Phlebotomus argentipes TaxID=94469 RepID=UPI0028935004|nr:ATP-binding cassette sub-family G member 1-like [Phlebotomus argentipes]